MRRWCNFKKVAFRIIADLELLGLRIAVFMLFLYGLWKTLK